MAACSRQHTVPAARARATRYASAMPALLRTRAAMRSHAFDARRCRSRRYASVLFADVTQSNTHVIKSR
ncbi:hypothetical protein DF133_35650 [Burkholderia cenocepacia]|nr:hypothetical protein DF133_35650 [Burkholderia cenocepacia]